MRRCSVPSTLLLLAALVAFLPTVPLEGQQAGVTSRADPLAFLTLGGRFNAQYQASSVDGAAGDFFIRRARLIADIGFNEYFGGRVQADFAGGGAELLDAYMRLDFDQASLYVGQFKRSFDVFELASSTDLSLIERDGRVAGYNACTGVGSVCSFSRLTEALDYAGRDTGVKLAGEQGALVYEASFTNGLGVGVRDENDGKSFAGRLGYVAAEQLVVSGNVGMRDWLDVTDETRHAVAWSADVEYGTWRDGLLVQAGVVGGDNWMSLDLAGDPGQFLAIQGVVSYYEPLEGERFVAVEPLARVSIGDPDGDVDDDGGTLFTPGVMFYLMGKNKIGVNLDYYLPQIGDSVYSFKAQAFLYF